MTNPTDTNQASEDELKTKASDSSSEAGNTIIPQLYEYCLGVGLELSNYQAVELTKLITADRKRVALEARLDCLKRLPTVTTNFMNNGAVSVVVLKNEIDRRIAELKAQQEEV